MYLLVIIYRNLVLFRTLFTFVRCRPYIDNDNDSHYA